MVLVSIPKPIKGPTIPVFKNLKTLNFICLDFSIKKDLLLINQATKVTFARKIDIEECSYYLIY